METFTRNKLHLSAKSHDCLLGTIFDKRVKFTYEAYNAAERCKAEVFDGYKWNTALTLEDTGIMVNCSIYVKDADKREARASEIFDKMEEMLKYILL
jgi:hypothetical protein